jgi:hypothetical protein
MPSAVFGQRCALVLSLVVLFTQPAGAEKAPVVIPEGRGAIPDGALRDRWAKSRINVAEAIPDFDPLRDIVFGVVAGDRARIGAHTYIIAGGSAYHPENVGLKTRIFAAPIGFTGFLARLRTTPVLVSAVARELPVPARGLSCVHKCVRKLDRDAGIKLDTDAMSGVGLLAAALNLNFYRVDGAVEQTLFVTQDAEAKLDQLLEFARRREEAFITASAGQILRLAREDEPRFRRRIRLIFHLEPALSKTLLRRNHEGKGLEAYRHERVQELLTRPEVQRVVAVERRKAEIRSRARARAKPR